MHDSDCVASHFVHTPDLVSRAKQWWQDHPFQGWGWQSVWSSVMRSTWGISHIKDEDNIQFFQDSLSLSLSIIRGWYDEWCSCILHLFLQCCSSCPSMDCWWKSGQSQVTSNVPSRHHLLRKQWVEPDSQPSESMLLSWTFWNDSCPWPFAATFCSGHPFLKHGGGQVNYEWL